MSAWRFALTPRWAGYLALAVAFAIACCLLGMWQFERRAEAREAIDLVETNYDRAPAAVDEVLPALDAFDASQQWTPVSLTGRYLTEDEMLVRNRPLVGQPGFEVLTPLLLDDGTVFIVSRGWVPSGSESDEPDVVPPATDGRVTVVARLKASEPAVGGRTARAGSNQIATVQLPAIAERLGLPTYTGAYGLIDSPAGGAEQLPVPVTKPEADEGPHLSYALQWFVFAIIGFAGLGWALREEYRTVNATDPTERKRADARARREADRAPTDAEAEDALLDRQAGG